MTNHNPTEKKLTRRHLLARAGLAAGAVYVAPTLIGFDAARASDGSGGASGGNSGPSRSSGSSSSSGPSRNSGPSRSSGSSSSSGPSRSSGTSRNSRPSRGDRRGSQSDDLPRWMRQLLGTN